MTRTYAARRLFEHGPLSLAEFVEITRWPYKVCRGLITYLSANGEIVSRDGKWNLENFND